MDVEALTRELQSRSRSGASPLPAAPMISPAAPAPPPDPPLSSSTANESEESPSHEPRAASELAGSTPSLLSYPDHTQSSSQATSSGLPASMIESIDLSKSSTSWVHEFDAQSRVGSDAVPPSSSASVNEDLSNVGCCNSHSQRYLLACSQSLLQYQVFHRLLLTTGRRRSFGGKLRC
jgi:hypothetical protein